MSRPVIEICVTLCNIHSKEKKWRIVRFKWFTWAHIHVRSHDRTIELSTDSHWYILNIVWKRMEMTYNHLPSIVLSLWRNVLVCKGWDQWTVVISFMAKTDELMMSLKIQWWWWLTRQWLRSREGMEKVKIGDAHFGLPKDESFELDSVKSMGVGCAWSLTIFSVFGDSQHWQRERICDVRSLWFD